MPDLDEAHQRAFDVAAALPAAETAGLRDQLSAALAAGESSAQFLARWQAMPSRKGEL